MQLLWLAHEGGMSGANSCLIEYMQILQEEGHRQWLVTPSRGALSERVAEMNIPVSCIPFYSWTSVPGSPPLTMGDRLRRWLRNKIAQKKMADLIRDTSPDFVLTNTITTPVGAYAARRTEKKHIWFVHEFGEEDHGFTIAGNFARGAGIMDRLSDKIVFNSTSVRQKFESYIAPAKRYIVHNPAVMPPLEPGSIGSGLPSPAQKLTLIMLGQIAPSKDPIEAVQALQICREKGLSFELNIVGKSDQPAYLLELQQAIETAGLQEYVKIPGPSPAPALRLRENHALLMCSRMEAFGRVTVEALKMGLPVIAANTGGSLELIEDGVNGYLYRKGDPQDLAAKILQLQRDYGLFDKTKIAEAARREFNRSNTALELKKVLC